MRSLIGIITIIATVIHFTFGCCMHPCHAGARGERVRHGIDGIGAVACDDCCFGQDAEPLRSAGEPEGGGDGIGAALASAGDACHDCDGCHCVATSTDTRQTFPWPPLAAAAAAPGGGAVISPSADSRRRRPSDPQVHPSRGRIALFERFLI